MKEDEKKVLLKSYNENILPINVAKDIYKENEGLDPLSKMSDVDIQIWLEGDIYLNVDKMGLAAGLEVSMIKDVTPIPHNGCRPPKRRRV